MSTTEATAPVIELSTFRLNNEWFGIDVLRVREVMTPMQVTVLPISPAYVLGLINVRGLIVTSISPKHRLSFADKSYSDEYHNIIVNSNEGAVCLRVDEIGDVVLVHKDAVTECPPTVNKEALIYINGVYKMNDKIITLLNIDNICKP
jgi:purine-binding chemotaxis protein CheW